MSFTLKNKKIGIFSDIHIGLGQDSSLNHKIVLDFAKWASETFLNKGISDIIIPGDIFHNRNEISVETLSIAKEFFDYFNDFRIFISTGNHDCFLKNKSDINSISILNGWPNINIIDKKTEILTYKDKKISLVPWGVDANDIPLSDIMFGHFEITTFNMNSYKICDHGMKSESLLSKSPLIISGHFHTKQSRNYKNGKIVYVGSPYQQNFGDCNEDRGIYALDLENEEFEFIENLISPKYYKISASKYIKDENYIKDVDIVSNNNIISLVIDDKLSPEDILSIKDKINKTNPQSIRVDYENNDKDFDKNETDNEYDSSNILKSIEDFIQTLDIDNKKEVEDYLKELYNKLT
jgi:DNA repair exonuclease SbcCD nuclease subunit